MRLLPLALAASFLFLAPAASGLRADPPPAPAPEPVPGPVAAKAPAVVAINISARLVQATERAARSLRMLGTARRPGDVPTFDPAALERRLRCWERAGHVKNLTSPRLTVYPEQRATISMLDQVSYVSDYDVEITGMASPLVANPVIQTIQEGLNLECVASLAPRGVTLSANLAWAEIKRPIAEFEAELAGGPLTSTKVRIQTPELRIRRAERRLDLAPGRAVLLADFPPVPSEGAHALLVWVEAQSVRLDPALLQVEEQVAEAVR